MPRSSSNIREWLKVAATKTVTIPDAQIKKETPGLTDKGNKFHQFRKPLFIKVKSVDRSRGTDNYPTRGGMS